MELNRSGNEAIESQKRNRYWIKSYGQFHKWHPTTDADKASQSFLSIEDIGLASMLFQHSLHGNNLVFGKIEIAASITHNADESFTIVGQAWDLYDFDHSDYPREECF